jgi:hypothetical protein
MDEVKGVPGAIGILCGFTCGLFTIYGIKQAVDRLGELIDKEEEELEEAWNQKTKAAAADYAPVNLARHALGMPKHR